ncbi:hypothetical protein OH807_38560 [Kitasatospora sp. NBC_01560]|uniref:hypothetical protein n=1 Tax=Kitasatospora sp. NBC_01560 TaxID=2975965 RepID=UPI003868BF4D
MTQPFHPPHHRSHRIPERWKAVAADHRTRAAARRWQHVGTEPRWARSDLPARRLLGRIFVPFFLLATVVLTLLAANALPAPSADRAFFTGLAVLCAVSTVVALVDLVVIRRRMAEQRRWHR